MKRNGLFYCQLISIFATLPVSTFANNQYRLTDFNFDFIAPIVADESDVPTQAGLIFYDIDAGLKVVSPTGEIESISTVGGSPVTSNGPSERIERVTVAA